MNSKQQPPSVILHKYNGYVKQYKRGRFLGQGGFAHVYEVESADSHRFYACKVIAKRKLKKKEHQRKLTSEIKLHQSLSHDNIVKFERFFQDNDFVYIMLECCRNRSLMELMYERKKLTEIEVRFYMKQILLAVNYLHVIKQVIHRDLKLGNLLLDKHMNIKLCDFGLATKLEFADERKTTICGTPNYIAPEILDGKTCNGHSYEVDIWSLGVIMFTLLVGKPPFETKNIQTTYKRIKKLHYRFPVNDQNTSYYAKNLISQILTIEPNQRPNLDSIEKHFFFSEMPIPKSMPNIALRRPPMMDELSIVNNATNHKNKSSEMDSKSKGSSAESCPEELADITEMTENQAMANKKNTKMKHNNNKMAEPNDYGTAMRCDEEQKTAEDTLTPPSTDSFVDKKTEKPVYVVKYMDYTKKYGAGYILSDGTTGIYFNDATKIVLHKNGRNVYYYDEDEKQTACSMDEYPSMLSKKMTLLKHFKSYLWTSKPINKNGNNGNNNNNNNNDENRGNNTVRMMECDHLEFEQFLFEYTHCNAVNGGGSDDGDTGGGLSGNSNGSECEVSLYVTRWMKTKHAVLFRLSNRTIQVNFVDTTKLIFFSVNKLIQYKDKNGNYNLYTMQQVKDDQIKDIQKRMKYAQSIIKKFRR